MKIKKYTLAALSCLTAFTISSIATAGVISSWDASNVSTEPGPYVDFTTYYSTIYTDTMETFGAITWKHGNVQPPGLKIVNGDDDNGTNCIMTTGYNPYDFSDKMCSDPVQSSKRFKLKSLLNAPLEVNYNVVAGDKTWYRVFQKWTDSTDLRWSAFTIELGFTVNGQFVASTPGDGLGLSDTRGKYITSTTSYQSKESMLSAFYAQGLAGPADKYHPDDGYFNITDRMSFGLIATEDAITSDGISASYLEVFGDWVNSSAAPISILWDDDGDINTDNIIMANCADASNLVHVGTQTGDDVTGFTCDGQWVTFREQPGLDSNGVPYPSAGTPQAITLDQLAPVVHTSITAALASGDPQPMYMDYIEDASNLGFTFWIAVDDNSGWPTPDAFTVRYTPVPVAGPTTEICTDGIDNDEDGLTDCADTDDCALDPACIVSDPEICDDGIDNDEDGKVDCADPDCEGIAGPDGGMCGPETGPAENCDDGYDNDGDSTVDCDDMACEPTAVCGGIEQICNDGLDNDFDGLTDCDDSNCDGTSACDPTSACSDITDRTSCKDVGTCRTCF